MNARYRWMSISPFGRAQLKKLAEAMQANPYRRDVKAGYSLITVRAEWLEGYYVERVEYIEKVTDPLGDEVSVPRVEFRRTEFFISTAFPQIELRNPARQTRPLMNLIGDTLDYQVAIAAISSPPLSWVKALAKAGEPVQVLGLRSSRFSLSNEVQASFTVNGTSDVRSLLPSLLNGRHFEVDSVVCAWKAQQGEWRVELKATGSANVITCPADIPGQVLRKALSTLE